MEVQLVELVLTHISNKTENLLTIPMWSYNHIFLHSTNTASESHKFFYDVAKGYSYLSHIRHENLVNRDLDVYPRPKTQNKDIRLLYQLNISVGSIYFLLPLSSE